MRYNCLSKVKKTVLQVDQTEERSMLYKEAILFIEYLASVFTKKKKKKMQPDG